MWQGCLQDWDLLRWKRVISITGLQVEAGVFKAWGRICRFPFKLGLESYTVSLLLQSIGNSKSQGYPIFKGKRYRLHFTTREHPAQQDTNLPLDNKAQLCGSCLFLCVHHMAHTLSKEQELTSSQRLSLEEKSDSTENVNASAHG